MKKYIITLILMFFVSSCSSFLPSRVASIVEFTSKISPNSEQKEIDYFSYEGSGVKFSHPFNFINESKYPVDFDLDMKKTKSVSLSKKIMARPILVDDHLYFLSYDGSINKYSLENRRLVHTSKIYQSKEKPSFGNLAYKNGNLYVIFDNDLIVISQNDMKEVTYKRLPDITKSPAAFYQDKVIFVTSGNEFTTLDTSTWNEVWSYKSWKEDLIPEVSFSPVVYKNAIIVPFSSGVVYCFVEQKGQLGMVWQYNVNKDSKDNKLYTPSNLSTQPLLDNDNVYLALTTGKYVKIDISTGQETWSINAEDVHNHSIAGEYIFAVNNGRQLFVLNKNTSKVIWTTSLEDEKGKNRKESSVFYSPIITKEKIYVISDEGVIYQLDIKNGNILSREKISKNPLHYVIWNNQLVVIYNNKLLITNN